jgi:hypothetical protein
VVSKPLPNPAVLYTIVDVVGQHFRLKADIIAIAFQDGKMVDVQIPAGAEILAIDSVPLRVVDRNLRVYAYWEATIVRMRAADIRERGIAVPSPSDREK